MATQCCAIHSADSFLMLGQYYFVIAKDYDLAIENYLLSYQHGNMKFMSNLATCYFQKNDYDNAIKYYLLDLENGDDDCTQKLASCYLMKKDYDNALEYYLLCSQNDNTSWVNELGICYHYKGDYDNVIKYYLMAIENGNYNGAANLGLYYHKIGKYAKAERFWSLGIQNQNSMCLCNMINYYEKQGLSMKLLVLCVDHESMLSRESLIEIFNVTFLRLKSDEKGDYLSLIMNFEFNDQDDLHESVRRLLSLLNSVFPEIKQYSKDEEEEYYEAKENYLKKCVTYERDEELETELGCGGMNELPPCLELIVGVTSASFSVLDLYCGDTLKHLGHSNAKEYYFNTKKSDNDCDNVCDNVCNDVSKDVIIRVCGDGGDYVVINVNDQQCDGLRKRHNGNT
jgi:TPR repeat protein